MNDTAISIDKLRCSYGQFEAVRGISLQVERGELFALLGTNGGGQDHDHRGARRSATPAAGRVRVFGMDPITDRTAVRRRTGVMLQRALTAGAKGFLPKGSPGDALADVIRRVHAGSRYVDPAMAADALTAPDCPLTPRELEVLRLAEFDTPVAVIARRTHLSNGTVRNYLAAVVNKLGVANRAEAFHTAHKHGWL